MLREKAEDLSIKINKWIRKFKNTKKAGMKELPNLPFELP